ncbi:response regulator [Candidatus Magnetominusculus xianensis]|uniref:Chemotaxis protein CheY n=1 Tax=Candidatus Magnetominusculus xianensis TaxID=1748249 RepID=A0ABR5SPA6_9BACT|nr:response regulator [Candidatus Magnetominusculus xianensis]KWT95117.1 chemotaxis protein CheY [Candidatus Magnetominusculus xianensis]MBF0402764.1 response regulator [Nitrospirota bacterium]
MKVLITEDDPISRRLLQKLLSPYGICDVSENGREALDAFTRALEDAAPYDIVCLDIMMPVLDGMEALKAMREVESRVKRYPTAKIIMTTALDSPKDIIEAYYNGGCTDYLVKPIDTKKLMALLREYGLIDDGQ